MNDARLPKAELRGTGRVLYRCATCGELMEPDAAVIRAGRSYHVKHAPEEVPDGR